MKFPYGAILRQALWIVRTHKFLWILGLLLVWGYLPNLIYINRSQPSSSLVSSDVSPLWLVALLVLAAILVIYFRARAAAIVAVKNIAGKKPVSFGQAWRLGRKAYLRMFEVSVLIQLSLIFLVLIMSMPVIYLLALNLTTRGLILGVLAALIFIPVWFVAIMVNITADVLIGVYDLPLRAAIAAGLDLVLKAWREMLLFGLCLLGITILAMVLSVVPAGLISLLFVILSRLAYHNVSSMPIDWHIITLIVSSIVFFLVQAIIAVYHQVSWVLVVRELMRPEKITDEELAEMPEPAID